MLSLPSIGTGEYHREWLPGHRAHRRIEIQRNEMVPLTPSFERHVTFHSNEPPETAIVPLTAKSPNASVRRGAVESHHTRSGRGNASLTRARLRPIQDWPTRPPCEPNNAQLPQQSQINLSTMLATNCDSFSERVETNATTTASKSPIH